MKQMPLSLDSYSTTRTTFNFYFPQVGQFGHYPSNVSIGEKVTARGDFNTLNVVSKRKITADDVSELNFDDLVQVGTNEQILDYLRTRNILKNERGFSFDKIMYLMQDKSFWQQTMQILREREIFNEKVWQEGYRHKDVKAVQEVLG